MFYVGPAGLGRFLIGREKEGVESEVARLINESLELDKTSRKVQLSSDGEVSAAFKVPSGLIVLLSVCVHEEGRREQKQLCL